MTRAEMAKLFRSFAFLGQHTTHTKLLRAWTKNPRRFAGLAYWAGIHDDPNTLPLFYITAGAEPDPPQLPGYEPDAHVILWRQLSSPAEAEALYSQLFSDKAITSGEWVVSVESDVHWNIEYPSR